MLHLSYLSLGNTMLFVKTRCRPTNQEIPLSALWEWDEPAMRWSSAERALSEKLDAVFMCIPGTAYRKVGARESKLRTLYKLAIGVC